MSSHRTAVPALLTAAAVVATALAGVAATATPAAAAVPAAPVSLPATVEPFAPYQPQTFCDPVDKPGPVAFGALLTATYPGTTVVDISRPCDSEAGTSEHKDGRALDWGVDVANPTQRAQANALLGWLLGTDAAGNKAAMLRRLGIMYVIWNARIWGTWSRSWQPYACSGVTACHQDHMHFSFDWSGARKKTSFWTGVASTPMPPPNYVYRATAFPQIVRVAAARGTTTPFRVLAGARYRFTVTGTYRDDATAGHRADAECSTVDGTTWSALAPGDTSASTGGLDLWVARRRYWRPTPGNGGGCNPTTHTYVRFLTFTTTTALPLAVHDPTPGDDRGTLTVVVQRVG